MTTLSFYTDEIGEPVLTIDGEDLGADDLVTLPAGSIAKLAHQAAEAAVKADGDVVRMIPSSYRTVTRDDAGRIVGILEQTIA